MRSVSTSLKNAIESTERVIRHSVTVDWDSDGVTDLSNIDDISHKIGQVTVDQSLESSLPQQVRIVPGAAVAQLDANLERGNVFRYDVAAVYRSIASASSGATLSQNVTVPRPVGVQPGELVVVALATINAVNAQTLLANSNVPWATLAIRGDGQAIDDDRCEGQCYIRRVTIDEPPSYTFILAKAEAWIAVAIRIGDPGLMGVQAFTSKGQDDDTTTYPIVSTPPITAQVPGATIVSIFAANTPVTGASWSPLDGDTERLDLTTTNAGDQCTVAVMTADNIAAGTYTKRATLSTGANVRSAVGFTIAFAPKLAGDEYQHAAWTYSELNPNSPFAGKNRFGRRTQWNIGFHGENGLESLQIFTGLSISSDGSSRSRNAQITALDNRETLRDTYYTVTNAVVAENPISLDSGLPLYPGLETTWVISSQLAFAFVNRSVLGIYTPEKQGLYGGYGYFASPPIRRGSCLWAPMHGSGEAFHGSARWAYTQLPNATKRRMKFVVGPFVAATEPAPYNGGLISCGWYCNISFAAVFTSQRQILGRWELYARFNNSGALEFHAIDSPNPITQQVKFILTANGTAVVNITMPGGITRAFSGPAIPTDGQWHFYGVHIDSPSGTAIFRVDNTSTTVFFTTWADSPITNGFLTAQYFAINGAQAAELQISGGTLDTGLSFGSNEVNIVNLTSPWMNENFVPSAYIDKSENELDAFPFVDLTTDTWSLLSAIAETEFAALYFDAQGIPHYRNTRSDVNAVGQTVQKALTARVSVKDLDYSSNLSQIANIVSVGYTPHVFAINQVAWQPSGVIHIPPFGQYSSVIQMPGLVLAVQGFNLFDGNTSADGSGAVISSAFFGWNAYTNGPYGLAFTIDNPTVYDVYLVDTTGQSTPKLTASWVTPDASNAAPVSNSDIDSIRRYREQPLSISGTVWRQRSDVAAMWAQFLVSELATPSPVIHDVPVVGDPRLELGDMTSLSDVNGLGVNSQMRITALKHRGSPNGGYDQSLTVRVASRVAYWNVNNWDDGTVWGI